jgi:serine/threonine-protein kinase
MDRILREEEPVPPSTRIASLGAIAVTVAESRKTDPVTLRRELKGDLDWITLKALEKDRARRYGTAAEFAADIERHLKDEPVWAGRLNAAYRLKKAIRRHRVAFASAVVFVLAVTGVFLFERLRMSASGHEGVKRLAVLPFENLGAAEDDYFADGIADAVRGKLISLPGVQVIARGSTTPYKKTTKTPRQIAQELEVRYLLTATVRWQKGPGSSSRVEVSPELVEVPVSGAPTAKWQQPFSASLTDVFLVQSEIASRVTQALDVALAAGEQKRLSERPTRNLAAYDAFLKGEEASKAMGVRNIPSLRKALPCYVQAVALDPAFAEAWARVSLVASDLYFVSAPTRELAERARTAGEKAVSLAADRPEGYMALGQYEAIVSHDIRRALEQYGKGRRIAPGNADLLAATARMEESLGRWDAALDHLRMAERLDPRSVMTYQRLGAALFYLRRFPEARAVYDRGLALAPANLDMIESKVTTYLGEGDLAGARAVLSAAPPEIERAALVAYVANTMNLVWVLDAPQRDLLLHLSPNAFDDDQAAWGISLANAYALKGDPANTRLYAEEARKALEDQLRVDPKDGQQRVILGLALAYLGRTEDAIREGERGAALLPVAKDAVSGPFVQQLLLRIYILAGRPENALDLLEPLLKKPTGLSTGWLRIDSNFDSLRGNPRFQKLVASGT